MCTSGLATRVVLAEMALVSSLLSKSRDAFSYQAVYIIALLDRFCLPGRISTLWRIGRSLKFLAVVELVVLSLPATSYSRTGLLAGLGGRLVKFHRTC